MKKKEKGGGVEGGYGVRRQKNGRQEIKKCKKKERKRWEVEKRKGEGRRKGEE